MKIMHAFYKEISEHILNEAMHYVYELSHVTTCIHVMVQVQVKIAKLWIVATIWREEMILGD